VKTIRLCSVVYCPTVPLLSTPVLVELVFTNEYHDGQRKDFAWVLHTSRNRLYKINDECEVVKEINLSDYIDILSTKFAGQDRSLMQFDLNGDSTGYEWQTKYIEHVPRIEANIVFDEYLVSGVSLSYRASNFVDDEYYNIAVTYDSDTSRAKMYVNALLVDSVETPSNATIYYKYDNSMILGGNMGLGASLNEELGTERYSINGQISDLRIYNVPLNNFDIKHIELLHYNFHDMSWNMPVGMQSFIEEVERFFKQKLPGHKTQFYNIKLSHLNITNRNTRTIIEEIIRETVKRVAPAYTELYNIIWE
jgi:hypothetical protein